MASNSDSQGCPENEGIPDNQSEPDGADHRRDDVFLQPVETPCGHGEVEDDPGDPQLHRGEMKGIGDKGDYQNIELGPSIHLEQAGALTRTKISCANCCRNSP